MYRVDHPTAKAALPVSTAAGTPGYYGDGDAALGEQATVVEAEHLNMLQEEIANCVESAGLDLDKADRTQLYQAMQAVLVASVDDATTALKGKVELATNAETIAGVDAARVVTPAGGAAAYGRLGTANNWTLTQTAPAFNTTSARRFKREIETIAPAVALSMLTEIELVSYRLKKGGSRHIGVIAEQLLDTRMDFAVQKDQYGNAVSVDYQALFSLSMVALQGLAARVAALEAR